MTPELLQIDIKLKILDTIIKEAQADNDPRWTVAAEQADTLNEQRAALLKAQDNAPTNTIVIAKVGTMGAKTNG